MEECNSNYNIDEESNSDCNKPLPKLSAEFIANLFYVSEINLTPINPITFSGIKFDKLISAWQNAIRSSNVKLGEWCAYETILIPFFFKSTPSKTNNKINSMMSKIYNLLMTICFEDISIREISVVENVFKHLENLNYVNVNVLLHINRLLTFAKKSQLSKHAYVFLKMSVMFTILVQIPQCVKY